MVDWLKKHACKHLVQQYLGNFLEEDLRIDQLSLDLYKGIGRVENVSLDKGEINDMLANVASPIEVVSGYIKCINVSIPWTNLTKQSCEVQIEGLEITVKPKSSSSSDIGDPTGSIFRSLSEMTTSMQLAEGCLKEAKKATPGAAMPDSSFQFLVDLIDRVISRVHVSLSNTIIRVTQLHDEQDPAIAVEVGIEKIDCFDEITLNNPNAEQKTRGGEDEFTNNESLSCKCLQASGVQIFLVERSSADVRSGSHSPGPFDSCVDTELIVNPSDSCTPDETPLQSDVTTEPMLIAKFFGSHELKVRIRHHEFATVPKIDMECFLGPFAVLLTPHMAHLLIRFADSISTSLADFDARRAGALSPVNSGVYQSCKTSHRVKQNSTGPTLETSRNNANSRGRSTSKNGSPLFLPGENMELICSMDPDEIQESTRDHMESEYGTSVNSVTTGFTGMRNTKSNRPFLNNTAAHDAKFSYSTSPQEKYKPANMYHGEADVNCRYQIHIEGFVATVLHSNPLSSSPKYSTSDNLSSGNPKQSYTNDDTDHHVEGNTKCNREQTSLAKRYFESCHGILKDILDKNKPIRMTRNQFASNCAVDHLRLVINGVHISTEVKSSALSAEFSLGKAELTECLVTGQSPLLFHSAHSELPEKKSPKMSEGCFEHSELLVFLNNEGASPDVRIRVSSQNGNKETRSSLHVHLADCQTEVDISIIDRINALFSYSDYRHKASADMSTLIQPVSSNFYSTYCDIQNQRFTDALSEDIKDRQVEIDVSCTFLKVIFRFPVADLRPEMQRRPWHTRLLRDEVLILEGHSFAFLTSFVSSERGRLGPRQASSPGDSLELLSFEITFKDLHVLFSDVPNQPKSFIYISQIPSDREGSGVSDLDYPHIKVEFRAPEDDSQHLLMRANEYGMTSQKQPKSHDTHRDSKSWSDSDDIVSNILKENATPSPFSQKRVMYNEREVILPGDTKEIAKFSDHAISTSHISITIQLPAVNMFLKSHSFFENLYNRINNDILLWAPAAPQPLTKSFSMENDSLCDQTRLDLASQLLINCDDDNSSSLSDSDDNTTLGLPSLHAASFKSAQLKKQSLLSIMTKIGYGKVLTECNVLSGDADSDTEHGEVVVMLENATIFNVTGYCGNPNLDYVCIQIEDFELFHKPNIPTSERFLSNIGAYSEDKPTHLDEVLRRCDKEISQTFNRRKRKGTEIKNMLDIVIKIKTDEKSRRCLIAVGLDNTQLQHRFSETGCNWFEQIATFFDATDDQVLGYKPLPFVTEIHLNFTDSAVTYKPLYMSPAVNSVITVSSFCFSSNIVTGVAKTVLDIMLDDAKLYITNKANTVDLIQDYACVLEINVLELCMEYLHGFEDSGSTSNSMASLTHPIIKISVSNNMIMIGTCADSCILLCSLIRYIANDGDFAPTIVRWEKRPVGDLGDNDSENSPIHSRAGTEDEESNLADLMADAVLEVDSKTTKVNKKFARSGKVSIPPGSHVSQSMMELHKPYIDGSHTMGRSMYARPIHVFSSSSIPNDFVDDDDFCVIDDELISSQFESEPVINYQKCEDADLVVDDTVVIIDNYFEPSFGKIDQLQAPKHFPTPLLFCTLNELSVIWYMYGGNDFCTQNNSTFKNKGRFTSESSRKLSSPVNVRYKQKSGKTKKSASNRDSTMLMELHFRKISARYEEYPDHTYEAKRFVLVVNDFEVKDKLCSSRFNKFLYRFHSEASPRRTHAKGLSIKLLQIRPNGTDAPSENKMRISLQPLRLNVDQDTLVFLTNFYSEISGALPEDSISSPKEHDITSLPNGAVPNSPRSGYGHSPSPVLNNNVHEQTIGEISPSSSVNSTNPSANYKPVDTVFFREVIFSPDVPIRLDYHGKRIDTELGTISGLLMGLGQLNCSQLKLKRIVYRRGILGVDKLMAFLMNEWASDIRANQLPSILGGLGPLHSVTQVFKGFRDLVYLPVEQYRKDGRIVRGIQRGATSFGTSTAMATLEMAHGALNAVHKFAETTHELISSTDPSRQGQEVQNWHAVSRSARLNQPADIREGVSNAFTVVKRGFEDTTSSIVKHAQREHDKKGVFGAVSVFVRHIPLVLVQPVVMATEATSNVVSGIRNQIKPDAKQQDEDKWKKADELP